MEELAMHNIIADRHFMKRIGWLAMAVFLLVGVAADAQAAEKLRVVTTVTMITDLVKEVGGEHVTAEGLMGPGVDPHLYKAKASDITKQPGRRDLLQRTDA